LAKELSSKKRLAYLKPVVAKLLFPPSLPL